MKRKIINQSQIVTGSKDLGKKWLKFGNFVYSQSDDKSSHKIEIGKAAKAI